MTPAEQEKAKAAQDEFAQLADECRLGWINRMVMHINPNRTTNRTTYHRHQPDIDMNMPVFWVGEMPTGIEHGPNTPILRAMEAIQEGRFKLPYPRCAFMQSVSASHPSLYTAPKGYYKPTPRYYVTVAEQDENDSILLFSFLHHLDQKNWSLQTWQAHIIPRPRDADIELAFDPESKITREGMDLMTKATQQRIQMVILEIHRLMTHGNGSVELADDTGQTSKRVNAQRTKLNLPAVPRLRVVDYSRPPVTTPAIATGTGSPKAPHYRRGTWRTLRTGRRVWIPPSAIHGGGDSPPPWYEIRQ